MQDVKQRVALSSIAASAGLTAAKAVVGLATGSLAILSEAAHSLLDLAATVMTYFAVRISGKPADEEHREAEKKVQRADVLVVRRRDPTQRPGPGTFGLAVTVYVDGRAAHGRASSLSIILHPPMPAASPLTRLRTRSR